MWIRRGRVETGGRKEERVPVGQAGRGVSKLHKKSCTIILCLSFGIHIPYSRKTWRGIIPSKCCGTHPHMCIDYYGNIVVCESSGLYVNIIDLFWALTFFKFRYMYVHLTPGSIQEVQNS